MDRISQKLQPLIKCYSEIHQNSQDVYWIATRDFKCSKYISPSAERNWGCPRDKVLKDIKVWDNYIFPADLKSYHPFVELVKRIKHDGPLARFHETYRIVSPDGRIRWALDRGHPIYDSEGEYIGITGVVTDITLIKTYGQLPILASQVFPEYNPRSRFYLRGRYQNIYLTLSEAKCAFFLLQGKTAKETAKALNLSPRTVEEILCNIKRKLGVIYRSDLCEALINGDFIYSLNSD